MSHQPKARKTGISYVVPNNIEGIKKRGTWVIDETVKITAVPLVVYRALKLHVSRKRKTNQPDASHTSLGRGKRSALPYQNFNEKKGKKSPKRGPHLWTGRTTRRLLATGTALESPKKEDAQTFPLNQKDFGCICWVGIVEGESYQSDRRIGKPRSCLQWSVGFQDNENHERKQQNTMSRCSDSTFHVLSISCIIFFLITSVNGLVHDRQKVLVWAWV